MRRAEAERLPASALIVLGKVICVCLLAGTLGSSATAMAGDASQGFNVNLSLPAERGASINGSNPSQPMVANHSKRADFENKSASEAVRNKANWVIDSGDNRGLPFVIIDKIYAKVFVFTPDGRLLGAAPALLGLAHGDKAIPGIGNRALSSIPPKDRITPAGRFVAGLGPTLHGVEVLWLDYQAGLALHRVITGTRKEHRAERLATPTWLDNRISYGCINVPVEFYNDVVSPAFMGTDGIVYVLPETLIPHPIKSLSAFVPR